MSTRSFILFATVFIFICCSVPFLSYAQQKVDPYAGMASEILALVNEHRAAIGRKPLVMNETITAAATSHSRNMASKKIPFGHAGFNPRMDKLGKQIKNADGFAENVAEGATSGKDAVELWLNSAGHKKNIEGDYNLTGIGIVKGKSGEFYLTQIFIRSGN